MGYTGHQELLVDKITAWLWMMQQSGNDSKKTK
jgi:hypothetical protein